MKTMNRFIRIVLLSIAILPVALVAQGVDVVKSLYDKKEYMIPTRDGVKLHTQVFTPKDKSKKYPIMIYRTPYSIGFYGAETYRPVLGPNEMYAKE
jgi:predicted acyl esterase